jgi:rhamnogalacturonyl hydrolase YesR
MESNLSVGIIDEIDDFSLHRLNKKSDLKTLFCLSVKDNKEKTFEELSFTAKYVQGLMRVLKTGTSNPEVKSLEHIRKDFTHNMKKIVDQMKEIVVNADEQIKRYFETTYFDMSQQGMQNLTLILSDLEWAKKYFNMQKRENSN